jgi:sialidase-1
MSFRRRFTRMEPHSVLLSLDKVGLSPSYGSVIPLNDGRLMWMWGTGIGKRPYRPVYANYSSDGGRSWGDPVEMVHVDGKPLTGVFTANLFRLPSGSIGLVMCHDLHKIAFFKSDDEGQTWSPPVLLSNHDKVYNAGDKCLTLSDGRLIVPAYSMIRPEPGNTNPKEVRRHGRTFGQAEACSLSYSYVFYSDDEGQTWSRGESEVFVPLQKGLGGNYSMGEPAVVELNDGRLLMFGRTNLGRIYRSYSDDRGDKWSIPTPTDLTLIPSPCSLKRIPGTGDLLVIWNQTSPWEAINGFYRHRLTCAISRDEGDTWENHRNLISLDDTTSIEPGPIEVILLGPHTQPWDRTRYHRSPGPLRCNEPTCTFLDGNAIITHGYCVFGDREKMLRNFGVEYDDLMKRLGLYPHDRGNMVHVVSTRWFYE